METPFNAGGSAPMPRSLWAASTPRPEPYPILQGKVQADVCIVGGGFMGLSAALALAQNGVTVALLEAAEIGWGASGRNNGLVAPGLKRDPWQVRKLLEPDAAERLLRCAGDAPGHVYRLIDEHSIDCDLNRNGWIQAAHSRRALRVVERRVAEWQALGLDADMIPAADVQEQLGTAFYSGASRYATGGSINPLAYAHGIAQAAQLAGASLFETSPAATLRRGKKGWVVTSRFGAVVAEHLLCCTNAYSDNVQQLRGTVLPLRTAQVASHPLPADVAAQILPGAAAASDTQRLLTSFRLTADHRLIMGGASATAGDEHAGLVTRLHVAARDRFPELSTMWESGWSGYLALTPDHLPQILDLGNGGYAGSACNGRGIGMATVAGTELATLICGGDKNECSVPVRKPKQFFGYGLRHIGVAGGVILNRFLDTTGRKLLG